MEKDIAQILKNTEEILNRMNERNSFYFDITPCIVFLILLFIIFFFKKKISGIKTFLQNSVQTNQKCSTDFQKKLCAKIKSLLSGRISQNDIAALINAIENKTVFPVIPDLVKIEYVIEKNDPATAKLTLSAILEKNGKFVARSTDWLLDFDFLPDELSAAYIRSGGQKTLMSVYDRSEADE